MPKSNEQTQWEACAEEVAVELSAEEAEAREIYGDMTRAFTPERSIDRLVENLRGFIAQLKSRPEPEVPWLRKWERELLVTLRKARKWGDELRGSEEPGPLVQVARWNEEEHFREFYFAAAQDFFDLMDRLDEPFPVR